ncbi:MAG: hypothetical protein GEV03_16975 [Streptosporangiales bacterium]|nr:hypothetical protein [Streptosporangiales bacterium]
MVVGTLLYAVKFERRDDALVDRMARGLVEEPLRELTLEDEYQAIVEALASSATLSDVIGMPDWVRTAPGEEEFRDFLRRLRDRLDAMRPWPTPPHRELDESRWPAEYAHARVVGRIKMRYVDAQGKVNYVFFSVQDGDLKRWVLILRLRSGDEVALVAPWWPDSKHVAVLSRDPDRPPSEVLAALFDGTRFTSEDVEPVPPNDVTNPRGA